MTRTTVNLGLLALASLMVIVLSRLGFWQLERADYKQDEQLRYSERANQDPLTTFQLLSAGGQEASLRFRRAEVSGHYDEAHQLLLDNRTENGVAGYHVYTPLVVNQGAPLLLVNRGWVAAGPRRDSLPSVAVGTGERVVRGVVEVPRADLFLLGDDGYDQTAWPRVVQRLDPVRVSEVLGSPVAPVVLLLDPGDAEGLSRHWVPYLGISPDRHRGYAAQWFALAATLLVISLSLFWKSCRKRG